MSIDYDLKSRIISLGLDELQRKVSRAIYCFYYPMQDEDVELDISYPLAEFYEKYYSCTIPQLWNEAKKINHARYKRCIRLKRYIQNMIDCGKCVFLTFTFSDSWFDRLSESSRKAYVQRFLRSYDTLYVANKDFGKDDTYVSWTGEFKQGTEREHFHAVIRTDKVNLKQWECGRIGAEYVRSIKDSPKLAQYVSKLTNHAIKETTKRSSLMYSRMTFADYEKKYKKIDFKIDEIENAILPFEDEYKQDCLFG